MNGKDPEFSFLQSIPEELLYGILNNKHDSVLVIDSEGTIRFISDFNKTITSHDPKRYIGKNLNEIDTTSKLMETVRTGKAEISILEMADKKSHIVCRIPVIHKGRVVGAVGRFMFADYDQFDRQRQKINLLIQQRDFFKRRLEEYDSMSRLHPNIRYTIQSILGKSDSIKKVKAISTSAAKLCTPVLITGESGTGKELFAHAIHAMSQRRANEFIKINCAAIPQDLMEAELFGYMPGAFTGASKKGKIGKFEKANNGTIFLDEIGDMPLILQAKLLRVLQEKEIERIGSDKSEMVDFRLITATNKDLKSLVRKGLFREDLYYRINVINIQIPHLRQRPDDIPVLLNHFLRQACIQNGLILKTVSPVVYKILNKYPWPGNVRELQNLAEQLIVRSSALTIEPSDLPKHFFSSNHPASNNLGNRERADEGLVPLREAIENTERNVITKTLYATENNKKKAAEILKIHRSQLYERLHKYKINIKDSN